MSGSYDECAGGDDTMDSFWEVKPPSYLFSWIFKLYQNLSTSISIDLASEIKQCYQWKHETVLRSKCVTHILMRLFDIHPHWVSSQRATCAVHFKGGFDAFCFSAKTPSLACQCINLQLKLDSLISTHYIRFIIFIPSYSVEKYWWLQYGLQTLQKRGHFEQ